MEATDLLIVGGGINGAGIARDAAGRGLRVTLCERDDLGGATSSASSKLVHGGLRYLEQLEFRLVAEALREREVLMDAAPHLVRPMRFVMPHVPALRSRLVLRTGLLLYDTLARRQTLPSSEALRFDDAPFSGILQSQYERGFAYSDCWVDDSRLVVANARSAADLGATVLTRTSCVAATRTGSTWKARLRNASGEREIEARALVNATGVSVEAFLRDAVNVARPPRVKCVQGSHIVVPRLYDAPHAYILQNVDGRVVFVYPYETNYTLIGTTDVELEGPHAEAKITAQEVRYLCEVVNRFFERRIRAEEIHWSYSGVRALVDDGAENPSKVTRDYVLHTDASSGPPLLSVYGGKITTYRRLAERVLDKLAATFEGAGAPWTAGSPLVGGDVPRDVGTFAETLARENPALPSTVVRAWAVRHGSSVRDLVARAGTPPDLGEHFGGDLYACEVDYLIEREWATSGEDVLWRRTKAGLHLSHDQSARVVQYVAARLGSR